MIASLAGCDPCRDLPCAGPLCSVQEGPAEVEAQISLPLGTLRRFANDRLIAPGRQGIRRLKAVPGRGALRASAAPAPISLIPIKGVPDRLRVLGTLPMHLARAPERAAAADFVDLGGLVARYETEAGLRLREVRGGWRLELTLGDAAPTVRLSTLPPLEPAMEGPARELLSGVALAEAAAAIQGLPLGRVISWPDAQGPAGIAEATAAMDGAMLRIRLRPRGRLGPGLDLSKRALDPGMGNDVGIAISPEWLSALAASARPGPTVGIEVDGARYGLSATLGGTPPVLRVRARRVEGCGWVDALDPVKIGRSAGRWGIAGSGEVQIERRGGGDRSGGDGVAAAAAKESLRRLDDRLRHPLFSPPDGRRLRPAMVRYEGGAVLLDAVLSAAQGAIKGPGAPPR